MPQSVTAGNSSGINDGASALILMARETATALGVKPLATVTGLGLCRLSKFHLLSFHCQVLQWVVVPLK